MTVYSLKARLNTVENYMGTTEAASSGSQKCEREGIEPRLNTKLIDVYRGSVITVLIIAVSKDDLII